MAQLVLKAWLNRSRTQADPPAVPITAEEIADDAVRVQAVGANAVHVHPRDSRGRQTLDPSACAEVIAAIRETVSMSSDRA